MTERGAWTNWGQRARDWVFGDRVGLAVFLGVLCFGMVFWRAGLFVTDNETLARTLEALSEGRLWVETAEGSYLQSPGAEVRDGRVYGRNYGQLVASLPALWLLRAVDAVANLRVALVAGWHLAVLALFSVVGRVLDRRRLATVGGGPVVLGSFVLNLALATRLSEPDTALLALQLTAVVAAALVAVSFYRLVALEGNRTLAVISGVASVVVLPVGFWAVVPKRHVFSVLACVAVLFFFARDRRTDRRVLPVVGAVPVSRAGAYAVVGLLTWVHAAEGLFVFLALAAVDLPTAPDNDRRSLAFVAGVFVVSLVPVVVTNFLVTGTPFRPPRELGSSGFAAAVSGMADAGSSGGAEGGGTGGGSGFLDTAEDLAVVGTFVWLASEVIRLVTDSLSVLADPGRLYHIFVRSKGAEFVGATGGGNARFAGTNLTVLEVSPVLAAGIAAVGGWSSRLVRAPRRTLRRVDPTVALAVALTVAYLSLYLSMLPLFAQHTQRYLLPVYPLVLYALVRSTTLGRVVDAERFTLCSSYAAGVLIGGPLVVLWLLAGNPPVSEAAQSNARAALLFAGVAGTTACGAVVSDRFDRVAAAGLGLAAAAGTLFLVASGLYYFADTGDAVLPVVQALTEQL